MLAITFRNTGQTNNVANYTYTVYVNDEPIATGQLAGHDRSLGWEGLVQLLAAHVTPRNPDVDLLRLLATFKET